MKKFEEFIEILKEFESGESGRKKKEEQLQRIKNEHPINTPEGRKEYSKIIAGCFIPCAKKILAGHFRVVSTVGGNECVREIYPTVLELYYHEEGPGGFKDPIMYHTTDRKYYEFYKDKYEKTKDQIKGDNYFQQRELGNAELPYFPLGSLNPHTSGIDITFENQEKRYRASCLIRKYEICFNGGKLIPIKNSTDLYDDLLLNGIVLDNNDCWIEWVSGDEKSIDIQRDRRQNVPKYNPIPAEKVKCTDYLLWEKDTSTKAEKGKTFTLNNVCYVRCPFGWQFKK